MLRKLLFTIGLCLCWLLAAGGPAEAQNPLACLTQTQAQLLAQFSDFAPTGSIPPAAVRNVICSLSTTMNALSFGVVPDGITPNDSALQTAVAACSAVGGSLVLPPGRILLTGGAQITLKNCSISGAGPIAGLLGDNASWGTTIELTSTSISPFIMQGSWSITGVNFYYPNQTNGTTVYPALFSDGAAAVEFFYLDHVNIINAYDAFVQSAASSGWGNWFISNSDLYAVHRVFALCCVGDSIHLSAVHFTPGTWLSICGFSTACQNATNAAVLVNKIFDITAPSGVAPQVSGAVNVNITNMVSYDWRYAFYLESGSTLGISKLSIETDGVATVIDSSSGGLLADENYLDGQGDCLGSNSLTNISCFNLGSSGGLHINSWTGSGTNQSFITTAGANVFVNNLYLIGIGLKNDGTDYYFLNITANSGGTTAVVQNSTIQGINGNAHVHGIYTGSVAIPRLVIQGNSFNYLNDDITITAGTTTQIQNNYSISTNGTGGLKSVNISGSNSVAFSGNLFDSPPTAVLTSCGTSPSPTIHGGISGFFTVGGSTSVTSCTLALPFVPANTGAGCLFYDGAITISPVGSGTPPSFVLTYGSDAHGTITSYNCPGGQ